MWCGVMDDRTSIDFKQEHFAARETHGSGQPGDAFHEVDKPQIPLTLLSEIPLGKSPLYLVRKFIPRAGLVVIWGPPKCGKSFLAFDISMHVALGWDYRGRKVKCGTVVYCAFEGQTGIPARAEAFRQRFMADQTLDGVPFYVVTLRLNLVGEFLNLIHAIRLQASVPALVVLDTLNRSLQGSESSDEDMTAYVNAAEAIKDAFHCAVMAIHHCGHNDSRPRGHSSLTAAADVQIKVRRDDLDNVVAEVEAAKDGPEGETVSGRLETVTVGTDDDHEPMTSCVLVPCDDEPSAPRGKKVRGAAKIALDLLHKTLDENQVAVPTTPHIPKNPRTTLLSMWRRYCDAGMVSDSDKPDSKRKAFVRVSKKLHELEIIGVWNDFVWIK
jgi:hypothetical protein